MKKLIFIFILVIFYSCVGNKTLTPSQLHKQDSIRLASQKRISDAIRKRKESSKVAFGEAKFGMSVREVRKTEAFKGGYSGEDYVWAPIEKQKIGEYNYDKIAAYFYNDSLAGVTIESIPETADYIDNSLLDKAVNLSNVITKKYGVPNTIYSNRPKIFDFSPNIVTWMYEWVIEGKIIRIGMKEIPSGSRYQVYADIFNTPMRVRRNNIITKKNEQEKSNDASKF